MRVLITGATGYIGTNLLKKLPDSYETYCVVRDKDQLSQTKMNVLIDLSEEADLKLLRKTNFDCVIHLASFYTRNHEFQDIAKVIDSNIAFGVKLLDLLKHHSELPFINVGSVFEYYEGLEDNPLNLYAACKIAFKSFIKLYPNIIPVHVKLADVFGPDDSRPKLMNALLTTLQTGKPLDMSEGGRKISLTFIDDVIHGFIDLLKMVELGTLKDYSNQSVALISKEVISLRELVTKFEKLSKERLNIHWGMKPLSDREIHTPVLNIPILPGWEPKISLNEGILRVLEGFVVHDYCGKLNK